MDEIDLLHGRGKNMARESYFKDNPEYLMLEYVKVMNNVSLYYKYGYIIVNGKVQVLAKFLLCLGFANHVAFAFLHRVAVGKCYCLGS